MSDSFFSRIRVLIPLVLMVLVGTLGFTFILKPSLEHFQSSRAELRRQDQAYQAAEQSLNELRLLQTQARAISPDEIAKLNAFFVESPETAHILAVLADRVTASGFFISSLEVGKARETEKKGPLQEISIQLQLKGGGYREFKQLLYLLARTVPLLDFSSFAFQPENGLLSLNLKAKMVTVDQYAPAVPIDARFFSDPGFQALSAPVELPAIEPVGRENPVAPLE